MCDRPAVQIAGEELLIQWFGKWPCFHDAEVISLFLARSGESVIRIYPYYPEKPATVEFILSDISDIELADFSGQNVIHSLSIEKARNQYDEDVFRLILAPCYGVAGRVDAGCMHVRLSPGPSSDGGSAW